MEKAVQKHTKVDIKPFLTCPVLLYFFILLQIFSQGFSEKANFWL